MSDEYKAAIRDFIERKGTPVQFTEGYDGEREVSTYGWKHYDADTHGRPLDHLKDPQRWREAGYEGCGWVAPEGCVLTEETYSQFNGTFADNAEEVGINVSGCHCKCGKYTDITLRFSGSLGDVLRELFGAPVRKPGITL